MRRSLLGRSQIHPGIASVAMDRWEGNSLELTKNILTKRKQAPIIAALTVTSRSAGTWIPKLSAFVKTSFTNPDQYFEIFPTVSFSLMVFTFEIKIWDIKFEDKKRWFCVSWYAYFTRETNYFIHHHSVTILYYSSLYA